MTITRSSTVPLPTSVATLSLPPIIVVTPSSHGDHSRERVQDIQPSPPRSADLPPKGLRKAVRPSGRRRTPRRDLRRASRPPPAPLSLPEPAPTETARGPLRRARAPRRGRGLGRVPAGVRRGWRAGGAARPRAAPARRRAEGRVLCVGRARVAVCGRECGAAPPAGGEGRRVWRDEDMLAGASASSCEEVQRGVQCSCFARLTDPGDEKRKALLA